MPWFLHCTCKQLFLVRLLGGGSAIFDTGGVEYLCSNILKKNVAISQRRKYLRAVSCRGLISILVSYQNENTGLRIWCTGPSWTLRTPGEAQRSSVSAHPSQFYEYSNSKRSIVPPSRHPVTNEQREVRVHSILPLTFH